MPFCLLAQKEVFIPNEWENDPYLGNWSWDRSYQSENFVLFWGPEISGDPATAADPDLRFNPQAACDTLEVSYHKFVDEIGFVSDDTTTNLGKYKIIIVINNTWGEGGPSGWAFGGSYSQTIGAMWVAPAATRDGVVLSHEFAHTLQNMNWIQENTGGGGFINFEPAGFFWETHANFMRAQLYPGLAKEDTPRWLATDAFHWSSTRHHYAAFRLLFHIQRLDGIAMINRLWNESQPNEHPLMTYRRLKGWNQDQFNNFIFDYARREVAYDYPVKGVGMALRQEKKRIRRDEPHFLWREYTMLDQIDAEKGRYIVPDELAPQDYGLNIIPLHPDAGENKVRLKFKGHTEVNNTSGWRYGFVTTGSNGTVANYGPVYREDEAVISYEMNGDEAQLYLVVAGAPTMHKSYLWEPGWPKIKRYPYEISMNGAVPEGYQSRYREYFRDKYQGAPHPNGGGFVASSARVAAEAYVGRDALVLGNSVVQGGARIEDHAWVENATVQGSVIIEDHANVFGGTVSHEARISGFAVVNYGSVSGRAHLKGNALVWGSTLGGDVVVGGDAEIGDCSAGVYLQVPHPNNGREPCDGAGADHPSNQDVNGEVVPFSDQEMELGQTETPTSTSQINFHRNFPNPLQESTNIAFSLPETTRMTIEIFNLLGEKVVTLVEDEEFSAGPHSIQWTPGNMASGIYICRLKTADRVLSRKMTYIRP